MSTWVIVFTPLKCCNIAFLYHIINTILELGMEICTHVHVQIITAEYIHNREKKSKSQSIISLLTRPGSLLTHCHPFKHHFCFAHCKCLHLWPLALTYNILPILQNADIFYISLKNKFLFEFVYCYLYLIFFFFFSLFYLCIYLLVLVLGLSLIAMHQIPYMWRHTGQQPWFWLCQDRVQIKGNLAQHLPQD